MSTLPASQPQVDAWSFGPTRETIELLFFPRFYAAMNAYSDFCSRIHAAGLQDPLPF